MWFRKRPCKYDATERSCLFWSFVGSKTWSLMDSLIGESSSWLFGFFVISVVIYLGFVLVEVVIFYWRNLKYLFLTKYTFYNELIPGVAYTLTRTAMSPYSQISQQLSPVFSCLFPLSCVFYFSSLKGNPQSKSVI